RPVVGVAVAEAAAASVAPAGARRTALTVSSAQNHGATRTPGTLVAHGVATRSCPARGRARAATSVSTGARARTPRRSARRVCRPARGPRLAVDPLAHHLQHRHQR